MAHLIRCCQKGFKRALSTDAYDTLDFATHELDFFGQKLWYSTVFQLFFLLCSKVISSSIFLDNFSFDLRQGAKHWMDKDVLADRAYFHSQKTGSFTSDGVERLQSYLQINEVKISIGK